jgi:hypothetical protein
MEELMKTEWLAIINRERNGTYPEWTSEPVVLIEDTDEKVFDIVDTKDLGDPIVRPENTGTATYYNGDEVNRYHIRFIKNEEFFNQFRIVDANGKIKDWAKDMSRPDYIVYDVSNEKEFFIIHELSEGSIQSKKSKAMNQLLNMVKMLHEAPQSRQFCDSFQERLCYVSASGCVTETPFDMANGFMEAYKNLPEPLPLNNASIERRGFKAYQTNVVKL